MESTQGQSKSMNGFHAVRTSEPEFMPIMTGARLFFYFLFVQNEPSVHDRSFGR
jgi:hypothetical protein